MQIYKFNSILKPVLWGGDRLMTFKGLPPRDEAIGESWELSAISNHESVVANGDGTVVDHDTANLRTVSACVYRARDADIGIFEGNF